MTSIKCASCGLVQWVTAENCKRCGASIDPDDVGHSSPAASGSAAESGSGKTSATRRNRSSKRWLLLTVAVLIVLALPATWLVVRATKSDQPKVFVLKDGKKAISRTWFHAWFANDPSGDEIFDHYLKASGWKDHSQDLKSYVANGRFEIKNEAHQTIARMKLDYMYRAYGYARVYWSTCGGDVELKGEGPDKLLITQTYDDCARRTWQRGTNGGTAWSRIVWPPPPPSPNAQTSPSPQPEHAELANLYSGLADLKRGAEFVNYLQLQATRSGLSLVGKSMLGDRVCYEVHSKPASGPPEVMYFDVETGLLLKFEHYRPEFPYVPLFDEYILAEKVPPQPAETYLENYREVNGVQIPFLVRQHLKDLWITMTISEVKPNPEIASSEFEKPSK
jgi:hypothetical protein